MPPIPLPTFCNITTTCGLEGQLSRLIVSRQLVDFLETVRITARPDPRLRVAPSRQDLCRQRDARSPGFTAGRRVRRLSRLFRARKVRP